MGRYCARTFQDASTAGGCGVADEPIDPINGPRRQFRKTRNPSSSNSVNALRAATTKQQHKVVHLLDGTAKSLLVRL
jgi:hypothetical protein